MRMHAPVILRTRTCWMSTRFSGGGRQYMTKQDGKQTSKQADKQAGDQQELENNSPKGVKFLHRVSKSKLPIRQLTINTPYFVHVLKSSMKYRVNEHDPILKYLLVFTDTYFSLYYIKH